MHFNISRETLGKANCSLGFPCLKQGIQPNCEVISRLFSGVLHTLCATKPLCCNCQPINDLEGFCCCVVRIELFEKYGI